MASNYFIEYTHYLNDLQNKLMKIQLRFNSCLENIRRDVNSGILTPEKGEELLSQRMDRYYENEDSKYTLSSRDVEFVRTYADVDRNGQILATFLKRDYLDKRDKLSAILESVRIYGYLGNLDKDNARLSVMATMHDYYNKKLEVIENKMNNLVQMYGEKEKQTRRYLELDEQRGKLLKTLNFISNLDKVSDEQFDKVVSQFYDVDKKYYEWFLKMQIKQEYEVGTVYQEHVTTMKNISSTSATVSTACDNVTLLNKELENTNTCLFNVLIGISQFDLSSLLETQEKPKKRLFKKEEEKNNRQLLFDIFVNLLSINGMKSYVEEMYGENSNTVNLNKAFDTFMSKKYGVDINYVDVNTFVDDIRDDVVFYYKDKIADLINKINGFNVQIYSNTTLMCGNIRVGMNQALLQKQIRDQYPAKRDELLIVGFTMDELERIYTDLKEFIGNGFSFGTDDEELFLRKV